MCYQSTVLKGFAFLRGQWANNRDFFGADTGFDAVLGQLSKDEQVDVTGLFPQDEKRAFELNAVNAFVVPKGEEYFSSPSMTSLKGILSEVKGAKFGVVMCPMSWYTCFQL